MITPKRKASSTKRPAIKKPLLDYEDKLMELIRQAGDIPLPVRQFKFSKGRRWRADFAWPVERVIVEVEGGVFSGGRHVTGSGFTKDCVKYNAASLLGFTVYRFTTTQIRRGLAIETLKLVFGMKSLLKVSKPDAVGMLQRAVALCQSAGLEVSFTLSPGAGHDKPAVLYDLGPGKKLS